MLLIKCYNILEDFYIFNCSAINGPRSTFPSYRYTYIHNTVQFHMLRHFVAEALFEHSSFGGDHI